MTTKLWIPKPNEKVKCMGKIFTVIWCDMGGKCRITNGGKNIIVDISELQKIN